MSLQSFKERKVQMSEGWNLVAVCLGGALGALSRYGLTKVGLQVSEDSVPWGILLANLLGCFLIGIFFVVGQKELPLFWKLAISVGLIGSLTTFSTLCLDFVVLFQKHPFAATAYLVGSFIGGIGLVLFGQLIARAFDF